METDLKIYLSDDAESFDFSGTTYYETTTFVVNMDDKYPISVKPKDGKTFNIWYQYGVAFDDVYSQSTMLQVTVETEANCIADII